MNILIKRIQSFLTLLLSILLVVSCDNEDETSLPVNVNFTNQELGISASNSSAEVSVTFSRAAESAGSIHLSFQIGDLQYGEVADFYTTPAMDNETMDLSYEKGTESVSFVLHAGTGLNIQEDKELTVSIQDDNESINLGENRTVTVTFSENFISASGIVELDGGGTLFPNQVFLDLSKLQQAIVDKYTWDLGFSTTSGAHHVILNSGAFVMARPLEKTNIDEVNSSDTVGFSAQMYVSNYVDAEASGWVDHQSGDLTQTAFGEIPDTDNQVFIIKRDGENRGWKKVRVVKDGENYTLQYADISDITHQSVSITKDEQYNFTFFDLDNGIASVEPKKDTWDIMYGTYAGRANFGSLLAIGYNDYVISNRSGVSVASVNTTDFSYEDFSSSNLSSLSLETNDQSIIGSSWRGLVDFSLVLKTDIFYVIRDYEGNHYKLKFNRLKSESEERGYPEIAFELLQ